MRFLPAPQPSDPVGHSCLPFTTILALIVATLVVAVAPVRAANTLSDPTATPATGTASTTFTFEVTYSTTPPRRDAAEVWVDVAGVRVDLELDVTTGTTEDGRWRGTVSGLAVGSWIPTFRATVVNGTAPSAVDGPQITVDPVIGPTPPPTPRPTRTPRPTPRPTPTPTPTPTLPPGATPRPPTPRPTAAPTLRPGQTPRPTPTISPDQTPVPTIEPSASASPDATSSDPASPSATNGPSASAGVTASAAGSDRPVPASGEADEDTGFVSTPWLVLGGGLSAVGTGVIVVNWVMNRRRPGPMP